MCASLITNKEGEIFYIDLHLHFLLLSLKKKKRNTWSLDKWIVIPWGSQLFDCLEEFVGESNRFQQAKGLLVSNGHESLGGASGPATCGADGLRRGQNPQICLEGPGTSPLLVLRQAPFQAHVQGCSAVPGSLQGEACRGHVWAEAGLGILPGEMSHFCLFQAHLNGALSPIPFFLI